MKDDGIEFGMNRVVEPREVMPVVAWKLDSSREISRSECRIAIHSICIEQDGFQQLCSSLDYDDIKIKAKILDIVNRRGKLHNPFTDSGGILYGTIEETGADFNSQFKAGDMVLCATTMCALPVHLDSIQEIDYRYGEAAVKGYAVTFQDSILIPLSEEEKNPYTMSVLNEAGSLYMLYNSIEPGANVMVIADNLNTAAVYMSAIEQGTKGKCEFTVLLDKESTRTMPEKTARRILEKYTKNIYIEDVTKPSHTAEKLLSAKDYGEKGLCDITINCEHLPGAGILAVLLTKPGGHIFFYSVKNNHAQALLVAESINKEISTSNFCQNLLKHYEFALDFLASIKGVLDEIAIAYSEGLKKSRSPLSALADTPQSRQGKADDFIYASPVTEALIDEALNIAGYDCNLIIQGETGTGKEKILSLIHKNSIRKTMPCVKINCATIPETLAESEFFGYEAGAFTGAQAKGKKGYFDMANGGILFLDEIGCLSLGMQSKLLRVIQEGCFYRVGGDQVIATNVRVICACNVPLKKLVEEGTFREDLYYRLNICTVNIPPLRDREEDVIAIAKYYIEKYNSTYGTDKSLDQLAFNSLTSYDWPGNVRELENLIHRAVISIKDHVISSEDIEELLNRNIYEDLVVDLRTAMRGKNHVDFEEIIEQQEKQMISYALKKYGSTRKAADYLHITQAKLSRKKQKYGL